MLYVDDAGIVSMSRNSLANMMSSIVLVGLVRIDRFRSQGKNRVPDDEKY